MNLFLIHGAWSSGITFNYLKECLLNDPLIKNSIDNIVNFEYDTNSSNLGGIIKAAAKELNLPNTIVIGHSMGGIVALTLEEHINVRAVVTVASPIAGIRMNKLAETFLAMRAPIISDITESSVHIRNLRYKKYTKDVRVCVSQSGYNPVMFEKTDGVVSIESQHAWLPSTATVSYIDANHHEVLQTPQFVEAVKTTLR